MDIFDISSHLQTLTQRVDQAAEYIREQWLARSGTGTGTVAKTGASTGASAGTGAGANPTAKSPSKSLPKPQVVIITGSGLGKLGDRISPDLKIPYLEIPYFAQASMTGHENQLILGQLGGKQVICLQGRLHSYQGLTALETAFPLLVAHKLGAQTLIVTNASGAINQNYSVGQIILICDHINFTGQNPITFNQLEPIPGTNLDMTFAYTPALQDLAQKAAQKVQYQLESGIYLGLRGASFETPAEIRMFAAWGADLVGMSTIHEVIAASRLGMQVLGFSLVSNMAAGILPEALGVEEVTDVSKKYADDLVALVEQVLLDI